MTVGVVSTVQVVYSLENNYHLLQPDVFCLHEHEDLDFSG